MSPYQLFKPLDAAIEAALRFSINRWGVIVPVVTDQHGNIIDGHHRKQIAESLGVEYVTNVMVVNSPDEAVELARTLNLDRRHIAVDERREMVADLRAQGFSTRAIAGAVGVSQFTVRRDLSTELYNSVEPVAVTGLNGKTYAPTRSTKSDKQSLIAQTAELLSIDEPGRDSNDLSNEAAAIVEESDDLIEGINQATESRRIPLPVPKRTVAEGVPPHPAGYSAGVLAAIRELLEGEGEGLHILDPFGGVGGVHQLDEHYTMAIEIEAEWAAAHPNTVHGDARNAVQVVAQYGRKIFCADQSGMCDDAAFVDAVVTSPAYGNRLADDYRASDPDSRRSYAIDLGRSLSDGNGGGMHFDTDGSYENLHFEVWQAMSQLLEPGAILILNCKDFQRNGKIMPVTGWHAGILAELGFVCEDIRTVPTGGLPFATARSLSEIVLKFRRVQFIGWHST